MSNERDTKREVQRIVRMLEATAKHLERASVLDIENENTSDGGTRCIRQFNNALARLYDLEALPEGLFDPLEENASLGDIGFAYKQVSTYLKEGISYDFKFEFDQEKETIGNIMKDVGEAVSRTIFSTKDVASGDFDESDSATVEVVEIEDDEKPDPVEPRLEKLEEQMETVVQILQELRPKKDKKDKKEDKE